MRKSFLALAATLALVPALSAGAARAASIGASASTNGLGLDAGVTITPLLGLRLDGAAFSLSHSFDVDEIDYDGDVTLRSVGAVLDLYPFPLSGFRLSAGARLNWNTVDVTATPTGPERIGGRTYSPAEIGRLDGDIEFDTLAPYAGIGWTGGFFGTGLEFIADLGVLFQGAPKVDLRGTGGAAANPDFAADVERERQELEDEMEDFKYYPVVKVGLMYRF
ncbi:hypothetical protein [Oleisolibacter albus]|uniref:hypothetical protein n=1 Tax=Oleisolibacter albus TaxID=2171757 RepID=UPI000DF3091D|nr:hypothetical protein [Oleisolibacter albus]